MAPNTVQDLENLRFNLFNRAEIYELKLACMNYF